MRSSQELFVALKPVVGERDATLYTSVFEKFCTLMQEGPLAGLPIYLMYPMIAILYGEVREELRKSHQSAPDIQQAGLDFPLLDRLVAVSDTPFETKRLSMKELLSQSDLRNFLQDAVDEGGPLPIGMTPKVGHA